MERKPPAVTYAYLRSDGTAYIVWGSAIAGLGAYAYQLLGGRVLGPEGFAPVSFLLTVHFLTFIVIMIPIEQLVVRRLTIDPSRPGLTGAAFWLAGATAAAATSFALVQATEFLNGDYRFVGFTLLTVAVHFIFATGRGSLAGRRRFRAYGLASGAASMVRLAIALAITAIHPSASGFAVALIVGPLVVLAWRPFEKEPGATVTEDAPRTTQQGLLGGLVLAAAASQALLLVGPIAVGLVGGTPAEMSIAFAAFTLGRAPLVFGYNLLARVLPPFTRMAQAGQSAELVSWARGIALAGVGLSLFAGALGWLLGPWAVQIAFGAEYVISSLACAVIGVGVALAGAALFVGQVLIAEGKTGQLALAWIGGVVAALGTLLITSAGMPITRVAITFLVGEAVALLWLVIGAIQVLGEESKSGAGAAYELAKRTSDIAVSLILLVLLAPLLLVVGIVVRLDSPGPVFFRQERIGKNGQPFGLLKVRTMRADADEDRFAEHLARLQQSRGSSAEPNLRIDDEDRVTKVGNRLRRWSIDELPNLWNVLRGSMSLVGPRPLVPEEADLVGLTSPRFTVKPGMTGLAQINGRDSISFSDRTAYDEKYVASRSLGLDFKILAETLGAVLRQPED